MRELNNIERKVIRKFIEDPIPNYIYEHDGDIDLLECYEIGFVFAHDLLKNHKINPRFSPWGDGKSVIFDNHYTNKLQNLLKTNLSEEMNEYCQLYLKVLEIFKAHFTQ